MSRHASPTMNRIKNGRAADEKNGLAIRAAKA